MNNLMEWNGLCSAENIRFEIYNRPSADAVGGCKYGHFTKFIFTINIKHHSVYRLYVCDFFIVNHKFTL